MQSTQPITGQMELHYGQSRTSNKRKRYRKALEAVLGRDEAKRLFRSKQQMRHGLKTIDTFLTLENGELLNNIAVWQQVGLGNLKDAVNSNFEASDIVRKALNPRGIESYRRPPDVTRRRAKNDFIVRLSTALAMLRDKYGNALSYLSFTRA